MTLLEAIQTQNIEEVKRLLTQKPEIIDERLSGNVPLSFASAKTGNLKLLQYIVEYSRASMNEFDDKHRNILHYGVESGDFQVVKYLVERVGMSPLCADMDLVTPFDLAHDFAAGARCEEDFCGNLKEEREYDKIENYLAEVVGFAYKDSYHNPIRTGMFPDPSIVRVGEDYYMVNSTFIFFPCIPVSHSKDLIHWEIIGYAITNPEWAMLDELEGGRGYWAPDISYYKGRFYITATYRLNDTGTVYRKQIVVSSEKPEGPYCKPAIIDEDGIDPSIFNDDDGRRYMLLNRGARIFELDETATKQISKASLLYYGSQKRAPEGPHLLKKDGYYYLFEAEGGTGPGHRITVSRSKTLMGVYEPCPYNPIMRQQDENAAIQRCGHGKPVSTPDGRWYMVYLCGRKVDKGYSILGRETALDPITWTADGWPIVNNLQGPSAIQKKPIQKEIGAVVEDKSDCLWSDGSNHVLAPGLNMEWMTPRSPEKNGICKNEGRISIKSSKYTMDKVEARNILLRRQKDFCFDAQAVMQLQPMTDGQEAGLVCYYDENTWVQCALSGEEGKYYISVKEHIGDDTYVHGKKEILWKDDFTDKEITFKVETEYLKRTFYYKVETDTNWHEVASLGNVYYLCDEGIKRGKRFTGAMVGMFAQDKQGLFRTEFSRFLYCRKKS